MIISNSIAAEALVSEREAATILGCTVSCLRAWRTRGMGVPHYRVGRLCRYSVSDLHDYLKSHRVEPAATGTSAK
jgi:hypothetical protein